MFLLIKNHSERSNRAESGMAYVVLLALLAILTTLGLAFAFKVGIETSATETRSDGMQAQYLAEAAANHAMWRVLHDTTFSKALQVSQNYDDVEENEWGNMELDRDRLEVGRQKYGGVRFLNVSIPQGAVITNAYIRVRSRHNHSEHTDLTIRGEATDDASSFTWSQYDLSSRARTTAAVTWNDLPAWIENDYYQTPDITAIIQEIVNRPGWSSGNAMAIMFESTDPGGKRCITSHDTSSTDAPTLYVHYGDASVAAPGVYHMHSLAGGRYGYKIRRHTDTTFATIATVGAVGENVVNQSYVLYIKPSQSDALCEGLVGYWRMDDSSGSTVAWDSSGNGNHGILNNMDPATDWVPGHLDGALDFDGSNDQVVVPHSAMLTLTDTFTLSAWIKNISLTAWGAIIHKGNILSETYFFGTEDDELHLSFAGQEFTTTGVSLSAGTWYHVAATFDNATNEVRLYVNGAERLFTTTTATPPATTNNVFIGKGNTFNNTSWPGALDDVRVYNHVLDPGEIALLYALTAGGCDICNKMIYTVPVAHWKLDDGSGSWANDSVGGHNGSVVGATWTTGPLDGALALDDSGDYVGIPDDPSWTLDPAASYTWTMWINPDDLNSEWSAIWTQTNADTRGVGIVVHTTSDENMGPVTNGISVGWDESGSDKVGLHSTDNVVGAGGWYHVAVTYNGLLPQSERFTIYVDGVDVTDRSDINSIGSLSGVDATSTAIGGNPVDPGSWFGGRIDDVRFYDSVLSAGEIACLFEAVSLPNNPPIVDAGPDQILFFPTVEAKLDGTIIDDGLPNPPAVVVTTWNLVSGPGIAQFDDASQLETGVRFSEIGTYVLRLTADDGERASFDDVTIEVKPKTIFTGTYSGNGIDNRSITGLGFQPDVVIIKSDDSTVAVIRTSTMSGDASKVMEGGDALKSNMIQSLDSDGFTVGSDKIVNGSGKNIYFVAFKAVAGEMKVGSYTGDGTSDRVISGMGGFQPKLIIVMPESKEEVVHRSPSSNASFNFDNGSALYNCLTTPVPFDGFRVGSDKRVNESGKIFHYVCWPDIEGKQKFSSYWGDAVDGREITGMGFEPEYVIIRCVNSGEDSVHRMTSIDSALDETMYFTSRSNANNRIQMLQPDGFQLGSDNDVNRSGKCFAYFAWGSK